MMVFVFLTELFLQVFGLIKPTITFLVGFNPYEGFGVKEYVVLSLVIGILEEGYCRYLLMDCLLMRFLKLRFWFAAIFAGVIFGLMHLSNATVLNVPYIEVVPQVVGAIFAGIWFAWLYKKIGLHMAILCHGLYDFLCFASLYLMSPSWGDIVFKSVFAIGGLAFILYLIKQYFDRQYNEEEPDQGDRV